ncbi:class I SAM-dependent methyltransferase [Roseospirillum parvum]|uniref:Methyltransferase domain-containing protein n=1 Tax=Roseospirillum parvum TaxID=83401 RepID=A0A1G8CRM1_9PROT|nr:class I SAM-dependent methyltransferase [Roseospirillum parvum]SDH48086.1 Methyltransferase domain-containing protein [Roseospirillum parvum]
MAWSDIGRCFKNLQSAPPTGPEADALWAEFTRAVEATRHNPPYHLKLLLEHLEQARGPRERSEYRLLDHGCGGGRNLFYLAVLGYTDFWGVDMGDLPYHRQLNAIAAERFGHAEPRLLGYDGTHLPLPTGSVDAVFSQQVLEHVTDAQLDAYYAEEGRVLVAGGIALHYVPHRLVPYDSHTRTWLIHYLPKPLYHRAGRIIGRPVPGHLHLRWPWHHRRLARRHIGAVRDLTLQRFFVHLGDQDAYDGPRALRRLLGAALRQPWLNRLAAPLVGNLVMLETLATKPPETA